MGKIRVVSVLDMLLMVWASAAWAQQYTLRAGSIWARSHSIGQGYDKLAELVKQKSNGRMLVQVFHESSLGNEREMAENLRMGHLEILGTGGPGIGRFVPEADIPEFPFLYENMNQALTVWDKFDPELDKVSAPKGFKILGSFHQGVRYIISRKPLRSVDDMKGFRLRSPESPFYIGMIKSWGATPIPMPFAEIYTSLQTGVIDGMAGPPISIWSSKYHEPAKTLILTGPIMTGQRITFNPTYYDKLPPDLQKVLQESVAEALVWQRQLGQKLEEELIGQIRSSGVTLLTPDQAFRSNLVKASHLTVFLIVLLGLLLITGAALAADSGAPRLTTLSGSEEVPPADPDGSGFARITLNYGQGKVCWEVTYTDIATPIAAHIHAAPAGVNGPVVVP